MNIAVSNSIYKEASEYAKQQGVNLSTVVENFLMRFVSHSKSASKDITPDIVLSLLGAGEPIAEDDLNAREAYQQYLEEKYK
jgi:hypothetical protein